MTAVAAARGGTRRYVARCVECGSTVRLPAYRCADCGGSLVIDAAPVSARNLVADLRRTGVWSRHGLLPETRHALSLGEANTPLIPLSVPSTDESLQLYAKLESLNPTLSFKDRAMALAVSFARDEGLPGLMLASTGNAAVSAAAYAAAADLPCEIFCATGSHASFKLASAEALGATVRLVDGDYSSAYAEAVRHESRGWLNVTTTYRNPLLAEAYRAAAVEISEQVGDLPDAVVVPVGAGPLLYGLRQGFRDLEHAGLSDRSPRLVGVQADACAPLAEAWCEPDWETALFRHRPTRPTRATAIADSLRGYEREGLLTLEAVRSSHGAVVGVSEDAIQGAGRTLRARGLLVEPAAAATLAAVESRTFSTLLPEGGRVVLMITGHSAKESPGAPSASGHGRF
jgi:threonine synthase